ncbi:iron complex transport system permease protein [Curtobacterium sp. PhB130]|uniref:iron ABC transporter permease n=1 Tax=Curtobacterium sp. PhB130 TaxID=2485178 RepID=UPI000FAED9DF|nr:iron ABC transporter permease [Curtobacterium sp. PhB130]ROS78076.1 iron complex transport system permease protein [Curtobacterium sp. PhB130]
MIDTLAPERADRRPDVGRPAGRGRRVSLGLGVLLTGVVVVVLLAAIDVTQGTAHVGAAAVWKAITGQADGTDASVVIASRLPRMVAGLLVGASLGIAGAAMQAVTRNVLAAPDTLAVNAGAYLALGVATVSGVGFGVLAQSGIAFAGGLGAAALVLALSGLGNGTVRLVLAGSALALGLGAVTNALILLFPQQTQGMYAWSQGGIAQNGFAGVAQMLPFLVVGVVGFVLVSRRVDALALGDDAARGLGVPVRGTRVVAIVLAVLLSAAAVTIAGPIGFVGLCAPALVRPLARRFPTMHRSWAAFPVAGLVGAGIVLASDVLLRAFVTGDTATAVPTGIVTSVVGAVFLVVMAIRTRDSGQTGQLEGSRVPGRWTVLVVTLSLAAVLVGVVIASVLLGDAKLLLGDVTNWLTGRANQAISFILDTRVPRVLAALLAGAALALAGTIVQAVTRNPLADPGVLGVSSGAGLGAVVMVTALPVVGSWTMAGGAFLGATLAAAIVFGLSARGGFRQDRLVLVGIGVSSGLTAMISLVIVLTDPFNATKALTWLSGSTYGRTWSDCVPVAVVLVLALVAVIARRRELDLVSLDEDIPRLLGVRLSRARLGFLAVSVVLTATAIAAVGTIGFVGLVAPHAARALVGRKHAAVVPVAVMLGAVLVCAGDVVGRTVIAPAQLGAGILTAAIGTPYFIWLLVRTPRTAR